MVTENQKWDKIHSTFDTDGRKRDSRSVDNVVVAWPAMTQLINDSHIGRSKVLDFGCGTGGFCRNLRSAGFQVEGMDFSKKMIQAAKKNSSGKIKFHVGDKKTLEKMADTYDIITSIMVLHFIKDIDSYIKVFRERLTDRGIIVFAVFNPDFVKTCFKEKVIFSSLKKQGSVEVAGMELKKGIKTDAFIRTRDQYKKIFEKHGFEYLSSRFPPFTQEFVDKYKWEFPSDNSEYLVMSVRKK